MIPDELGRSGLITYTTIAGLSGVIFNYIVAGFGLKYWNVPEKAHICLRLGIALIILHIVTYVAGLIVVIRLVGSLISLNLFTFGTGLVLPIIYVAGAEKLRSGRRQSTLPH